MFKKFERFLKIIYLKFITLRKIFFFKLPKECDVIIYDGIRSESILEYINPSKKVFVLITREIRIYLNLELFFKIIKQVFRKKFISLIFSKGIKKGLLRYSLDEYHIALIKKLNPKIVVTLIDNNPRFGRLFDKSSQIRFIAIQNGNRSRWDTNEPCKHDFYLNFTNKDFLTLTKLGWEINESVNFGSINAARVFSSLKTEEVKRDLLIISSWRGNILRDSSVIDQYKAAEEMHFYLSSLIVKENYKAEIILRQKRDDENWFNKELGLNEEQYYKKFYGERFKIIENNILANDVYQEISNSHLSVALLTTSILEGHIYGHNCLYLNFCDDNFYHQDLPRNIVISQKNRDFLELKIKNKINDSKDRRKEIISLSRKRSEKTLKILKNILNQ